MDLNFDYPDVLNLFTDHLDPKRAESASFLIWYLENYYRLESGEATDHVCDQGGDKGIDGVYVNDDTQTIHVFQSRISQRNTTVGDAGLREFAGTLQQLTDRQSVEMLIASAGTAQVSSLLSRLQVPDKIDEYEVQGEYLSNINLDQNGSSFLQQTDNIVFVGRDVLSATHISDEREVPIQTEVAFDISGFQVTEYAVDSDSRAFITPIRARDLLKLDGIGNQTLFTHNVRGTLGNTNVNRGIVESIRDPSLHKKFPLFHNGVTIIADSIERSKDRIAITDYFVVNGCQSLTALFLNDKVLTDDLFVLTKFIQVQPTSTLAKQITEFSNNQNGVRARDFKANSSPQIRLKNEFALHYMNEYEYSIKRGETSLAPIVISNEDAGLYLMAFDLEEPWATHRKYQVFDDKHSELFARPEVTADRIVMLHTIREVVDEQLRTSIDNTLLAKYVLTRYLMMYIVKGILQEDTAGKQTIAVPKNFVREEATRARFRSCIRIVLHDVAIDLNAEVEEHGDDFDYRGRLRDQAWVKELRGSIVAGHKKLVARTRIPSFQSDWESAAP